MGAPTIYPKANTSAQWFQDDYPGGDMGETTDKLVLHTTETGGWPGYRGGASAPTLTYDPQAHRWRQHFGVNRSARALRDPSGTAVRENRDRVVQVEIIACSDRAFARKHGYLFVGDLDDQALKDLGEFAGWLHEHRGLPLRMTDDWLEYPASYGDSSARWSGPKFDDFRGICSHQNVSGNTHGDVDARFNRHRFLAHARAYAGYDGNPGAPQEKPADKWDGHSFPGRDAFAIGKQHPAVVKLDKRLIAHGFDGSFHGDGPYEPGPTYTRWTRDNVRAFQRAQGWRGSDADGYPGPVTWRRLMQAPADVVDLSKIRQAARKDTPRPQGGTTPGAADDVRIVEAALRKEGLLRARWARDGSFGSATVKAYSKWQRRCGYRGRDADGIPGEASLEKLGRKYGFRVVP